MFNRIEKGFEINTKENQTIHVVQMEISNMKIGIHWNMKFFSWHVLCFKDKLEHGNKNACWSAQYKYLSHLAC